MDAKDESTEGNWSPPDFNEDPSADNMEGQTLEYTQSDMDRQYATFQVPRRVHILGTGSIGKLVAHSIRGIANPPPVTLLLHKRALLNAWKEGSRQVTVSDDGNEIHRKGFDVELMPDRRVQHGVELKEGQANLYDDPDVRPHRAAKALQNQDATEEPAKPVAYKELVRAEGASDDYDDTIHNLIVTTKAAYTVAALAVIKHRLKSSSTICFLQNGMGVIEEVNEKIFPDEDTRPNYMQGVITHGANVPPELAARNPYYVVHAGHGTISLSLIPSPAAKANPASLVRDNSSNVEDRETERWADSSRYLLRTLTRTPVLCAVGFTPTELLQLQLEKLAVNSVLNPLTVLLDARNGSLLYNFAVTRTLRLLLAETSLVIRSLPELQNIPNVETRFSSQRLETLVFSVANTTRNNISSMLADVRGGRQTEAEYINGYIVKRGEEMGIKCVVNYAIMQTVLGKSMLTQREARGEYATEPRDPSEI